MNKRWPIIVIDEESYYVEGMASTFPESQRPVNHVIEYCVGKYPEEAHSRDKAKGAVSYEMVTKCFLREDHLTLKKGSLTDF